MLWLDLPLEVKYIDMEEVEIKYPMGTQPWIGHSIEEDQFHIAQDLLSRIMIYQVVRPLSLFIIRSTISHYQNPPRIHCTSQCHQRLLYTLLGDLNFLRFNGKPRNWINNNKYQINSLPRRISTSLIRENDYENIISKRKNSMTNEYHTNKNMNTWYIFELLKYILYHQI